jgi:hypothetical protein
LLSALPEPNFSNATAAAQVGLIEQAAVPGGISAHEFTLPGGWRDRALRVVGQTWPDA